MLVFDQTLVRRFILLSRPLPMTDFNTKAPLVDKTGAQMFRVQVLVVLQDGRPAVIAVKVPAAPATLEEGLAVTLEGLTGILYERDGRQAVSFRASKVTPVSTAGPK
jgi:hypothetical protein